LSTPPFPGGIGPDVAGCAGAAAGARRKSPGDRSKLHVVDVTNGLAGLPMSMPLWNKSRTNRTPRWQLVPAPVNGLISTPGAVICGAIGSGLVAGSRAIPTAEIVLKRPVS
jgi:hypothetical protein